MNARQSIETSAAPAPTTTTTTTDAAADAVVVAVATAEFVTHREKSGLSPSRSHRSTGSSITTHSILPAASAQVPVQNASTRQALKGTDRQWNSFPLSLSFYPCYIRRVSEAAAGTAGGIFQTTADSRQKPDDSQTDR